MQTKVLSVAGFDPSGGAGLLADIKTFQTLGVQGFAVASSITVQNEYILKKDHWLDQKLIKDQIDIIMNYHSVSAVKIGITQNAGTLTEIVKHIRKKNKRLNIIWDPVFKSSGGFCFWETVDRRKLSYVFDHVNLITPNLEEYNKLWGKSKLQNVDCKASILLKTAKTDTSQVTDQLRWKNKIYHLNTKKIKDHNKHGTGCVLSAAMAANTALGLDLLNAWKSSNILLQQYMMSSTSLLGRIPLNLKL